jgi:allantoinase
VVWTEARKRGHGLADLARWLCARPAELAGLASRKGRIAPGQDADLVAFDPDGELRVTAAGIRHRHTLTPYEGERLQGVVHTTILRGAVVYGGSELAAFRRGALLRGPGGPA